MSDVFEPIDVKRILVSLDNSPHSIAALEAAVDLARHFNAELHGIFIEDVALLNLAQMPFCQEVGEYTATVRKLTSDGVSRGIFVQSRWVIRSFRKILNQTDLNADFIVLRGEVKATIEKEAQTCDLIVIGKSGTNPLRGRRLGSTAKALIKYHNKPLLLVEENNHLGYPMIILFADSPSGKISLETARDLLSPEETLMIMLCEDDQDQFTKYSAELNQWAQGHNVNITIQGFKSGMIKRFIQMITGVKTGLLILPHDDQLPYPKLVQQFLDETSLPILLIRSLDKA